MEKGRAEVRLSSWAAAPAVAKNRDRWRALASGPIPHLGARKSRVQFVYLASIKFVFILFLATRVSFVLV